MKLASFLFEGSPRYGAVTENGIVELTSKLSSWPTLKSLLAADGLAAAAAVIENTPASIAISQVEWLPVIPDPDKIICIGLNYREHVAETGRDVAEKPTLFARYAASQVGHLAPLVKPIVSDEFDFEGEVAVIIGKAGRHIPAAKALEHIAGYSCYNDASVRDWQRHTSQFLAGKTFASTGAFGPWLVTADEIADPARLTIETRLNGQVVQHATTDLMITSVPELMEYISTILPLAPGDVIVSGTPGGIGARRKPPLFMKHGDVVEVEVDRIGVLLNTVVEETR